MELLLGFKHSIFKVFFAGNESSHDAMVDIFDKFVYIVKDNERKLFHYSSC